MPEIFSGIAPYSSLLVSSKCLTMAANILGSYYITGDERGWKKRPKYEWSVVKQL